MVPGPFAAAVLDRLAGIRVPVHLLRGNGERAVENAIEFDGQRRGRQSSGALLAELATLIGPTTGASTPCGS